MQKWPGATVLDGCIACVSVIRKHAAVRSRTPQASIYEEHKLQYLHKFVHTGALLWYSEFRSKRRNGLDHMQERYYLPRGSSHFIWYNKTEMHKFAQLAFQRCSGFITAVPTKRAAFRVYFQLRIVSWLYGVGICTAAPASIIMTLKIQQYMVLHSMTHMQINELLNIWMFV